MANGDGFDFGFDPGSFFGGILATIEALIVAIINALIFLYNLLVAVFTFLYNIAVVIAKVLVNAVKLLVKGIVHVISDIIHGRFVHLFHDYLDLKAKITAFLKPVLRVLQKIRAIYKRFVIDPLLRTINLIQRIRQFLTIFRILGFKWATKLDTLLTRAEQRLVKNVLVIQAWLNFAISILDLVIDPSLILRKNVLLASLLAFLGAVKRVVFFGANRTKTPAETKQGAQDSGALSKGSNLLVSGFSHSAEYSPTVQRIFPCIDSALAYYAEKPANA